MMLYKATNPTTKKAYIGQTRCSLEKRKGEHRRAAKRGDSGVFYDAIRVYGFGVFEWIIIEKFSSQEILNEAEIAAISCHKTLAPNGYNSTAGGYGHLNHKHSEETKQKISKAHRGKILSQEHKDNMSKARKGVRISG